VGAILTSNLLFTEDVGEGVVAGVAWLAVHAAPASRKSNVDPCNEWSRDSVQSPRMPIFLQLGGTRHSGVATSNKSTVRQRPRYIEWSLGGQAHKARSRKGGLASILDQTSVHPGRVYNPKGKWAMVISGRPRPQGQVQYPAGIPNHSME
jgi:hypothetical protein